MLLVCPGDKLAPLIENCSVVEHIVGIGFRFDRFTKELHISLSWSKTRLVVVTWGACANYVVPDVRAAARSRDDMVAS